MEYTTLLFLLTHKKGGHHVAVKILKGTNNMIDNLKL